MENMTNYNALDEQISRIEGLMATSKPGSEDYASYVATLADLHKIKEDEQYASIKAKEVEIADRELSIKEQDIDATNFQTYSRERIARKDRRSQWGLAVVSIAGAIGAHVVSFVGPEYFVKILPRGTDGVVNKILGKIGKR